ncbi:hypothetical protein BG011_010218 [Mortierella polycephala]|uniref:Uncharacterized protein n=1 Tax=Mortierella polycephala TaxID=41804 RepID=A0A9P6TVY0_9FUNG|nr:hypothetical protein BG011_010218 [Mortierella polycephala]
MSIKPPSSPHQTSTTNQTNPVPVNSPNLSSDLFLQDQLKGLLISQHTLVTHPATSMPPHPSHHTEEQGLNRPAQSNTPLGTRFVQQPSQSHQQLSTTADLATIADLATKLGRLEKTVARLTEARWAVPGTAFGNVATKKETRDRVPARQLQRPARPTGHGQFLINQASETILAIATNLCRWPISPTHLALMDVDILAVWGQADSGHDFIHSLGSMIQKLHEQEMTATISYSNKEDLKKILSVIVEKLGNIKRLFMAMGSNPHVWPSHQLNTIDIDILAVWSQSNTREGYKTRLSNLVKRLRGHEKEAQARLYLLTGVDGQGTEGMETGELMEEED